jgi:hypothetical protein
LSEESAVGVGPTALDCRVAPRVSSRACRLPVVEQLAVDHIGQQSLQAPHGFLVAVACGPFAPVVGPARGVAADLGDRMTCSA